MNNVPLFPLNTVLFPGGRLPLRIFEQRYMDMAKVCLKDGSPFGVCLIVEGREVGDPAVPAEVGTLARISHWDMPQLGVLEVVALGSQRFRIKSRRVEPSGLA
ncbi:MAG TPA: LON peptidase substrate-binding domain-containing protein, partial [Burkholderiales bacterium]